MEKKLNELVETFQEAHPLLFMKENAESTDIVHKCFKLNTRCLQPNKTCVLKVKLMQSLSLSLSQCVPGFNFNYSKSHFLC